MIHAVQKWAIVEGLIQWLHMVGYVMHFLLKLPYEQHNMTLVSLPQIMDLKSYAAMAGCKFL